MRVYVRLNNVRRLRIPVPIGLVKVALSFSSLGVSIAKRYIPEEQRQYVDYIPFKELKKSLDVLRSYKGLKIVEVKNGDGTEVTIIV